MPHQSTSRLLWITLGGGLIFLVAAITIVVMLLTEPAPTADPVVVASSTEPAEPPPMLAEVNSAINDPMPSSTPHPTDTPSFTPTLTPRTTAVAGDKLALPTATRTPSPTPIPTNTPTPAPVQPAAKVEGLRVGNVAPNFTLGSNRANRVSLSDLRGKVVVLNFWATWCPPCRHEVPALQSIHNELGPQGVVVLAVNEGEKLENVERFAHDNDISFNVWLDEDRWAGNIYQVRSIPTTYFIDQEGIIQAVQIGSMSRDQILAHLDKLL